MEEKLRILKLLEIDKISVKEAIALLEALKETELPHKSFVIKGINEVMDSVSSIMKDISQIVSDTVRKKVKDATEKAKEATEKVKKVAEEVKKGKS